MSIMAEAQQDPIIVYECTRCYVIIPYLSCYHNCPAVEEDQEEEGFQEDLVECPDCGGPRTSKPRRSPAKPTRSTIS